MAHIDNLVERISDPALREQIATEVAKLVERKDFGLVFQHHMPQDVEVPGVAPRRGDTVRLRADESKTNYLVLSTRAGVASIVEVDATKQTIAGQEPDPRAFDELVVVKDFDMPIYPGLKPLEDIEEGGDKPAQVVIEGENYYALETLLYTHEGKVDVIYIDPPYNTGSDDWQYNDRYVDGADAYRHSKWLAFIERRLIHARRLLKDSGAIFVSIDDNEQAHLRLLLDQVFGAENFLDTIVVESSTTSGPKVVNAQQGTIVKNVEYVHVFKKSDAFDRVRHTPLLDGVQSWDANYSLWLHDDGTVGSFLEQLTADERVWADIEKYDLKRGTRFAGMPHMNKLLMLSAAAARFIEQNVERIARTDRVPVGVQHIDVEPGTWRKVEAESRTYVMTKTTGGNMMQIVPLVRNYRMSDDYSPRFGRTVIRGDLWKGFHSDMAHVSLEGGVAFANGKKPIRLIKQLIRWANNSPDTVILDFFGGSGSTTHAVMSMNAEDGGRRQSILVTNNELPKDVANRLRRADTLPGDREWETEGVFWKVTLPRIRSVVAGGAGSEAYAENVAFYKLTYEDENLVALGRKFDAIAPLLWMKSGAVGTVVRRELDAPWVLPGDAVYGILFDTAKAKTFAEAVAAREKPLHHVFVVTDSESAFQAAIGYLPTDQRLGTTRLYSDYLHSFEINGKG